MSKSTKLNSFESAAQRYNYLIHQEPWASVSHSVFWGLFWIAATPVVLGALIIQLFINLFHHFVWNKGGGKIVDPKANPNIELAVVITGCDGGFGNDFAWAAAQQGFTVFAGCLLETSFKQFQSEPRIIPIKMDVTSESDVQAAAERVTHWLNHSEVEDKDPSTPKKRYLHALVNNAGMAITGLIDWLDMASIERQMQVNFFGTIRTCKAFLHIFKEQAPVKSPRHYANARIINMISGAGLNAIGTPTLVGYEASKNALESFTASLRWEMKQLWNVQVTAMNPSFHDTPMPRSAESDLHNTWNNLSPVLHKEYGQDYFDHLKSFILEKVVFCVWPAYIVTEELMKCLHALEPPAQLLVGMDARFVLPILRMVPAWARTKCVTLQDQSSVKPAKMMA